MIRLVRRLARPGEEVYSRRLALIFLVLAAAAAVAACVRIVPPPATAVNPPSFPQPLPAPPPPPQAQELPPPPTENRTFVTIEGVPQYKIGAGDVLEIFITRGATQERFQAPVRANGRVAVSLVEVPVDGLTADQAAANIAAELALYFRRPSVEVLVKEFNSKKVSVLGAVGLAPRGGVGTIPLTGRTTLLEVIAKAGGLAPNASLERVRITRAGGQTYVVNMFRYVQDGDVAQDFVLDAGDVVFVPERVVGEERRVFLLGEVRTPGPIPYFPSLTLSQLVAQAGGWTDNALFEEARVIRGNLQSPEIISVDLRRLMLEGDRRIDQFLRPNDVVYIPRTRIANWNAFLAQLRPTLEFITLSVQPVILYRTLEPD